MSVIETDHLTKYYGNVRGIEDVSFTVEEGEIFGFIGPNGAGKTTTIRTLLGLIFPTRGTAKIFGRDAIADGPEIRQEIGYLPGEVFYYSGMKVVDILKYAASFYKRDCTERMYELAEYMELDLNRRVDELSYGNRKKVGIVQGLMHRPRLVFLDEPTSGLDPLMQQKFFDLIRRENERGMTVFFSSHILGEVQRLCHRVAIIREGRIVEIADIPTLQRNLYKKVHVVAPEGTFSQLELPGMVNFKHTDSGVRFFFKGDVNQLLRTLSTLNLIDVTIENPSLEEIFLHYYETG